MHLECRRGINRVMSQARDEVANNADIGIQRFGSSSSCASQPHILRLCCRASSALLRGSYLRLRRSCRWGSRGSRIRILCRLLALRLELAYLSLQRYDTIFKIPQPLFRGCVSSGLRRCWRGGGGVRLVGRWRKKRTNRRKKKNIKKLHY